MKKCNFLKLRGPQFPVKLTSGTHFRISLNSAFKRHRIGGSTGIEKRKKNRL